MFSKGNSRSSKGTALSSASRPAPSIVSANTQVVGDIASDGEVQIDGRVEGNIRCHSLTVGESGSVTGEISADSANVFGHIKGQIRARSVTLAHTSKMVGDVIHELLAIESGAQLEGYCRRMEADKDGKVVAIPQNTLPAPRGKAATEA